MQLQKSIKIKLNPTEEQSEKLTLLIDEYIKVCNFVISKISEIQKDFIDSEVKEGICSVCNKQKKYKSKLLKKHREANNIICLTCYNRNYSQFSIQKKEFQEKIGLRENNKISYTYLTNAIRFVSDNLKGFDKIRDKKEYKLKRLYDRLNFWTELLNNPSKRIEKKFRVIKYAPITDTRENPHFYSESEINSRIKRLEKKIKKFKMPKFPEFKNKTISLQRELYSWKKPNELKISSITNKNESIDYFGKNYLSQYMEMFNTQRPVILLKKEGNSFYLCFPISKKVILPKVDDNFTPVGIDWGITRSLAVASILDSKTKEPFFVKFYRAERLLDKRKHYKNLRKKLGHKKRLDKIKNLGSSEDRFTENYVQNVSTKIIQDVLKNSEKPAIFIENIEDNREEATKGMRKNVLIHSVKERSQNYLIYKSLWEGIPIFFIKPEYTSQTCSKCGYQNRDNRPQGSKIFKCLKCGYSVNSDFNASINIALKFYTGEYEPAFIIDDEEQ